MNHFKYIIFIFFLFLFSCNRNVEIEEMNTFHNDRVLHIMKKNPSYKFNYFYYEVRNYDISNCLNLANKIEHFVDNNPISDVAKNKGIEIYYFFYPKKWWNRKINLNDTEEVSDNGLIYDRDLIALVSFRVDENRKYVKKTLVYDNKKIMYEKEKILK